MSSKKDLLFDHHIVAGIYPVADAFHTAVTTDYICLRDYRRISFLIITGVGTTGTQVITINAATSAAGAGATTMAYRYKVCASSTTVDTWGASTNVAATGFTTTAGSNYMYLVEVLVEEAQAALAGANFVSMTLTEGVSAAVVGSVIAILSEPRYPQPVPLTAIA